MLWKCFFCCWIVFWCRLVFGVFRYKYGIYYLFLIKLDILIGFCWLMKFNFYNCVFVFVFWKLICIWINERLWNVSLILFFVVLWIESVIYICLCKNLSYIYIFFLDVVCDRFDKKLILMYVLNLYNKLVFGVIYMIV